MEKPQIEDPRRKYPPGARWHPAVFVATGGWVGFAPFSPGTVGALWGLPLAWGVDQLPAVWLQMLVIVAICLAGVPICDVAARQLGNLKDPGCICYDEFASMTITFFLVPTNSPANLVVGFLLHRVFDITKPPPARQLERLPGGWGINLDDWAAGAYSCTTMHLLIYSGAMDWISRVMG